MQRYKDTLVFVRIAAVSLSACSFYRCLIFNLDMVFLWPHAHEDKHTLTLTHTRPRTHTQSCAYKNNLFKDEEIAKKSAAIVVADAVAIAAA